MIIRVDVDGTLCYSSASQENNWDYSKSVPITRAVERVNRLYDRGHEIIIWTSRGVGTGKLKEAKKITIAQMKEWGVKYHRVEVGKPYYDIIVDDKALNPYDWATWRDSYE